MVNMRDGAQIVRGLSLILDHYCAQNKGPALTRARSAQYHATELFKIMVEQAQASASSAVPSPASHSDAIGHHASSSYKQEADMTGFDSIARNDSEEFHIPLERVMEEDAMRKKNGMREKKGWGSRGWERYKERYKGGRQEKNGRD